MIGERLRYLREEKGNLQKELADFLNVKQETYSSYERNRTEPSLSILKKICEFYNVSADFFIEPNITITTIDVMGLTENEIAIIKYICDLCTRNSK